LPAGKGGARRGDADGDEDGDDDGRNGAIERHDIADAGHASVDLRCLYEDRLADDREDTSVGSVRDRDPYMSCGKIGAICASSRAMSRARESKWQSQGRDVVKNMMTTTAASALVWRLAPIVRDAIQPRRRRRGPSLLLIGGVGFVACALAAWQLPRLFIRKPKHEVEMRRGRFEIGRASCRERVYVQV
jgi:hypothetical protein